MVSLYVGGPYGEQVATICDEAELARRYERVQDVLNGLDRVKAWGIVATAFVASRQTIRVNSCTGGAALLSYLGITGK